MGSREVKSILIIRPSAIGDIVMASPMIRTLREGYPESRISWLAEPHVADLLRHNPDLSEVIVWPKAQWRRMLKEGKWSALARDVRRLGGDLRRRRFDLVLDAVGLLKSRFLARLSGGRERIGFTSREPGEFLMSRVISRGPSNKRMSSEYRYMMEELGLEPGQFRPNLVLSADDLNAAARLQDEHGLGFYAVLAPFTTRPQKHWFEDRWGALAAEVRERLGLTPVILGGPSDIEAGNRIQAFSSGPVALLAGKTTLSQTAALVKGAALLVGVDTGLTHMGTAFGLPTVALFGATCPYLETASPLTRVLYKPHPCSPCKRSPTCDGDFTCMRALTVDEVIATAADLLEKGEVGQ